MLMRSIFGGFLSLMLVCHAVSQLDAQETIPATPAGKRLAQVVEFVNGGGDDEFLQSGFLEQSEGAIENRKQQTAQVRDELGKFEIQNTTSAGDFQISAMCKTSKGPGVVLSIHVSSDAPHPITRIELEVGGELPASEAEVQRPLTAEERAEAIDRLATELESTYVFPEVAEKMVASIQASLEKKEYDDIHDADRFANHLTDQLREICQDKHFRVRTRSARRNRDRQARREVANHGFVKAEMLPGGIGYLKFNFFDGDPAAEKTAAAAMNFLASSKAIVFDLRENGGGSPRMIAFLSGYLFDESVHLNSFYNRPSDTTTESWSRDDVPGERLGDQIPVYVLTSNDTFSGAEEFSYNLKHLNRGTLVGETTGGGAHPVRPVTLGSRFEASMPFARAINPVTQTNWEGTGVKPHVEVDADQALDKAVELARAAIDKLESTTDSAVAEEDADQLLQQAQELMANQEFDQASVKFKQVVAAEPDNGLAWFQLGYSLHAAGQLDEAIQAHQKAAEFEQVTVLATYNLACAYALQNETDKAISALEDAVAKGFSDAQQLEGDSDLDSLRSDKRFRAIAKKLGSDDGGSQ